MKVVMEGMRRVEEMVMVVVEEIVARMEEVRTLVAATEVVKRSMEVEKTCVG